jgi:hypothetical protein
MGGARVLDETAVEEGRVERRQTAAAQKLHAGPGAAAAWARWQGADARDCYHHLMQADGHADASVLSASLVNEVFARIPQGIGADCTPRDLANHLASSGQMRARRMAALQRWRQRLALMPSHQQALWLLPLAPSLLADGCWLQHASSALNSHELSTAPLLRTYLARGGCARRSAAILRQKGFELEPCTSSAFAQEPEIDTAMYALPSFALALSQFPTLLLPEVLGFNIGLASHGPHVLWELLIGTTALPEDPWLPDALEALEAAIDAPAGRVACGIRAAWVLLQEQENRLEEMAVQGWFDAPARMARLIQRKASVAMAYHSRVRAGGPSLDTLFAQSHSDPRALLKWMAKSSYVAPGQPERSRLVIALASPRGSMAGVLAPREIDVVREWIRQLPEGIVAPSASLAVHMPDLTQRHVSPDGPALRLDFRGSRDEQDSSGLPLRMLYHRLLHIERYPALLPHAYRFAQLWLARAGLGLDKGEQPLPFSAFCHRAFADWLAARHAVQLQGHVEASAAPPPTREELIASCVQLCPMVYIDGAWLQRIGQVGFRDSPVATRLQTIYLEEVGAGDARENHPNLYRELMDAMGVEMPLFGTEAFAHWQGFGEASFRLPVMWLCLSQFPRQFLPELLGFTLAVELSGVGGSYRTSSDALRRHGYPSTFVDVHNTIDNITSGHTALAFDAIRLHLDEAMDHGGPDEVQRRWKRVWTGWRAIVPPAGLAWN